MYIGFCLGQQSIPKTLLDKHETKKPLALCLKPLTLLNNDKSLKLIEWFEMLKILGFEKVIIYLESMHPNIAKAGKDVL